MTVKLKRKWKHYGLRTSGARRKAYGGFQWPKSGIVECPDWSPEAKCGNGLHALLNGEQDAGLLNWCEDATWQLVGFDEYVDLGGKVKFPRCEVATGTREEVATALHALTGGAVHGLAITAGYYGTATAGNRGTATAGNRGTATAGNGGTATAGNRGTATAGNGGTATAGYYGTATAGNDGTATAGYYGTATAGNRGTATAGNGGILQIKWWDGSRYRIATAYVGEDGIKPGVAYKLDGKGKFVEAGQ